MLALDLVEQRGGHLVLTAFKPVLRSEIERVDVACDIAGILHAAAFSGTTGKQAGNEEDSRGKAKRTGKAHGHDGRYRHRQI